MQSMVKNHMIKSILNTGRALEMYITYLGIDITTQQVLG